MGDSDDEYDRKRRDKFRGERAEASYRGAERVARPRDDWSERDSWSRPRPREYRSGVRDRGYSPSLEPAPKRIRHDYYGENYYNHYAPYQPQQHRELQSAAQAEGQQPPMMSFKAFLATQDDNISDSEAIEKYNDYKLEFQRQQLNEFFVSHKDDEWFRLKYHPEDSVKRKDEQAAALKKRVEVFIDLLNSGKISAVTVDCARTNDLLKLLDTVVIKLEGGSDEDLTLLEKEYEEMEQKYRELKEKELEAEKAKEAAKEAEIIPKKENDVEIEKETEKSKPEEAKQNGDAENKDEEEEGIIDDDEKEDKPAEPEEEKTEEKTEEKEQEEKETEEKIDKEKEVVEESKDEEKESEEKIEEEGKKDKDEEEEKETRGMMVSFEVALADPQPERRWMRRGWVTFKRDANIKEICWNLNNIRLRECELGAIVNRDLSRRIRPVNGITAHKTVVRSDIRISAKVTLHLDTKAGLWSDEDEKREKPQQTFGLVSNNPVLHNITDYLIEEASAEEEELLGLEPSAENQDTVSSVERDEQLISVLDRIILYLRIVHSVDYYNHCEYPNEDEMPNRCGILHARGPPPTSKTDMTQFTGSAIESKMSAFLPEKPKEEKDKNEAKLITLALKDVDTEIDKFVQANTRELAKDKWLCPLSGKKFKGPDFVRKHIFNKHAEKLEEVKKEVEFFNNYLKDLKRPMLAEAPHPKREETPLYNHSGYAGGYGSGYSRPAPYYNQNFPQRSRGYQPRTRGGPGDFRPVIHYRDLDAPREPEEFI